MLFQEKDVICFLGDSMTAGGYWMAEAYQEIRKKVKVKCYNCGVSGGTAYRAEGYLYSRCLAYNPDWVVVMFGINDIDIIPYDPEYTLRVATKFPRIAADYYAGLGRDIDIIKLNGSIELAPLLGLSDVIVDIVETGKTLLENGLEPKQTIVDISARLIANKVAYKFKNAEIRELCKKVGEYQK